ncbi:geranylgeranyl reductase family protein [candidate division GN15 bacterium]|nr:geranylgeranyl reductase family protein [candidate division GN15 bacterium]
MTVTTRHPVRTGEITPQPKQLALEDTPPRRYDVIIVGGGPAGSIAGLHLADAGYDVLIAERDLFPRDKACGDCLLYDSLEALRRAGLGDDIEREAWQLPSATIYSPGRHHFDVPGQYCTLRRKTLDTIIAYGAGTRGAALTRANIVDAEVTTDGTVALTATGRKEKLRARLVMLATGAQVHLATKLGLITRQEPSAIAVRRYVKSSYRMDKMILSYDRTLIPGYAWIIPLGNNNYNVGCGCYMKPGVSVGNLKRTLQVFLEQFPQGRELMAASSATSKLTGAALRCGLTGADPVHPSNRILAIGETVGTTFPFTGEGIGKAMETGELAAQAVDEAFRTSDFSRLTTYPARIQTELRPKYRGYFFAERWLSRPWLNDFVSWRIQKSPLLQQRFKEFMSDTGDPRKVFAVATVLRSFFS